MPFTINFAGAPRTAKDFWYQAGGTLLRSKQVWRNVGGTWQQFFAMPTGGGSGGPTLAVVASPSSYSRNVTSAQAGNGTIPFTATASGGAGGYSFAWTRLAVGSAAAVSSGEATATLTLRVSWIQSANAEFSETWQVTATDANGATATFSITFYFDVTNPN